MSELRRLRVNKQLTVAELADRSGVSADQIRNIEEGRTVNPRVATLVKLADVFEVKPSDIDPKQERRAA